MWSLLLANISLGQPGIQSGTYIRCASLSDVITLMPSVFSRVDAVRLSELELGLQGVESYRPIELYENAAGAILKIGYSGTPEQESKLIQSLFPHYVAQKQDDGWILYGISKRKKIIRNENDLQIQNANSKGFPNPNPLDPLPLEEGCLYRDHLRLRPYLPTSELRTIRMERDKNETLITQPVLQSQQEFSSLIENAKYPRQRRVLQFELEYAPIILHLNFSPISWLRHHGFPLEESELENLMRLDPFAAGSLAIFDFQYGAPEKYPRLVAIPFKGIWAPKKEAVESKLIRLFKTAQFDYRQTDRGYRWREWELVPVDGGLFISRDQQMLDEALETYTEPTGWTLLNGHQEEFFKYHPLAVHFSLSKAAKRNKLRSNSTLPTELSVGLSVQEGEWTAVLRSNLKGSKDISETLSLFLNREPPKQRTKLHPIANNILTIASEAERTRNLPDHLTHAEILEKGWIDSKKGEYYVQMHFSLPQVHYCSTDKNNEMVHYTWSDGILYKNPLPCR